jgi:hypothetical protein
VLLVNEMSVHYLFLLVTFAINIIMLATWCVLAAAILAQRERERDRDRAEQMGEMLE